jgi:Mor family transcriptional regulator
VKNKSKSYEVIYNGFHYYLGTGTKKQAISRLIEIAAETNRHNYEGLKEIVTEVEKR